MQYHANSPHQYLNLIADDWRKETIQIIRNMMRSYGPELQEGIEYNMLCYGNGTENLFHLNAQKDYVSLYVGSIDKIEGARELLSGFDLGKGCIRIKKRVNIDDTNLELFIKKTIDVWRGGGDTSC